MNNHISDNTKAILLLTAPLLIGKGKADVSPLTLPEYNKLARYLAEAGNEPADLLKQGWRELFTEWQSGFETKRIGSLLERGFLLSQAINHWQERAIWVVSRADAEYPQRIKARLGAKAPAVLYGCGNQGLLEDGGLAVVGSRKVSDELVEYAESIGSLAATSGCTILSGAARGVDQAAMRGALRRWGTAIGVLTGDLEREVVNREHREMLMEGHLALLSPYDPKVGFNVGHAMQRNKLIYALADAGLVIESDHGKGGTWTGAVEQLEKLCFVPVYARDEGEIGPGLKALRGKGALAWPNPETPDEFKALLSKDFSTSVEATPKQAALIPIQAEAAETHDSQAAEQEMLPAMHVKHNALEQIPAADALFAKVEELLSSMGTSITESDVTGHLQVEKNQARVWLKRLVSEGKYKRLTRPVRYVKID